MFKNDTDRFDQHFLVDQKVIDKFIKEANLTKEDIVVEIGPGNGVLTKIIAPQVKKLYVIELDQRLKDNLEALQRKNKNIELIFDNCLNTYIPPCDKIITSLPYSIIEPFINKLVKCEFKEIIMITGNNYANNVLENKNKFNKCLFVKNTIYYTAYMLAMPIGGFIAEKFSIVATYYITLFPAIIGLIVLLFLNENKTNIVENNSNITSKLKILKNGLQEIKKNSFIKIIILTNAILLAVITLVEESHPDYSTQIGITEFQIGLYTSLILVFCIIGSYVGSRVKEKYHNILLYINPLLTGFCILLLGILNNKIGILFLLIMYIFEESFDNIMLSKVHNSISSESRVTVESLMSMLQCVCGIVIGTVVSICLNYINVNISYIILGVLIIGYSILVILYKIINNLSNNINKI